MTIRYLALGPELSIQRSRFDVTSAESKATYQEIKDYMLEHSGLRMSSLYIAQVKQKHGIIERECYNAPKTEGGRVPQCPEEKVAAIEDMLVGSRIQNLIGC